MSSHGEGGDSAPVTAPLASEDAAAEPAAGEVLGASSDSVATMAPGTVVPLESLQEWAERLWKRIDRNQDGVITMEELNCDEFQRALRLIGHPTSGFFPPNTGIHTRSVWTPRSEGGRLLLALVLCMPLP